MNQPVNQCFAGKMAPGQNPCGKNTGRQAAYHRPCGNPEAEAECLDFYGGQLKRHDAYFTVKPYFSNMAFDSGLFKKVINVVVAGVDFPVTIAAG